MHHLREIERRRLFSELNYPSLYAYVVKHLKYSENEANSRISAMRLMRDIPDIAGKIESGALSMTNICLARKLFAHEKKAGRLCDKRAILSKLEGKSSREALKIVSAVNPDAAKVPTLSFDSIGEDALREKLLELKGRFGHIDPNMDLNSLLHKICDHSLKTLPCARKAIHHQVWVRDEGRCTNCGSTHALEYDHIRPRAAGGKDTLENLRLLCRNCNQRAAVRFYGRQKMRAHMN